MEPKMPMPELSQIGKKTVNIQPGKTLVINLEKIRGRIAGRNAS